MSLLVDGVKSTDHAFDLIVGSICSSDYMLLQQALGCSVAMEVASPKSDVFLKINYSQRTPHLVDRLWDGSDRL